MLVEQMQRTLRSTYAILAFEDLRFRLRKTVGGIEGLRVYWSPTLGYAKMAPSVYRLPVIMAFLCLSVSFCVWPAQKNLGTLISCSAAVMVAAQFWHGDGGGLQRPDEQRNQVRD